MASKQFIPATIQYTTELANSINAIKSAVPDADVSTQTELLLEASALLTDTKVALAKLTDVTEKAAKMPAGKELAIFFKDIIREAMDELRAPVDKLEMIVDKKLWPVPSYGDLIFEV